VRSRGTTWSAEVTQARPTVWPVERWAPGTTVLHRNVYRDEVWFAAPVRVIEDDDDGVVTWLAPGTSCRAADIGGLRRNVVPTMAAGGWGFREHTWFGWGQLLFWPTDCSHSVWPMHDAATGELTCWYLNLQAPVARRRDRLDTLDLFLDVLVDADLGAWRWKDEGELEEALAAGIVEDHTVARLRVEGERLTERLPTIAARWGGWIPEAEWLPVALPDDWDQTQGAVSSAGGDLVCHDRDT
jgi:hypothetical protein